MYVYIYIYMHIYIFISLDILNMIQRLLSGGNISDVRFRFRDSALEPPQTLISAAHFPGHFQQKVWHLGLRVEFRA